MTAKLTLTATVPPPGEEPMVVECERCESEGKITFICIDDRIPTTIEKCPDCKGTGTRAVRYRVVAEVEWIPDYEWGEWGLVGWTCDKRKFHPNELAQTLVQAHLTGDPLPGVEVTELEPRDA